MGLLVLAGVYRSKGEAILGLWDRETGRPVFRATMSRKRFGEITSKLRFDDKLSRPHRLRQSKLAPILTLWTLWEERLGPLFQNTFCRTANQFDINSGRPVEIWETS